MRIFFRKKAMPSITSHLLLCIIITIIYGDVLSRLDITKQLLNHCNSKYVLIVYYTKNIKLWLSLITNWNVYNN